MPSRPAPCPSCEYDLGGIVDSWRGSCPLEGVCSECGAAVRWSEVLAPPPASLPWFVEHRWWRVGATWVRTLVPWRFWRAVGAGTAGSAWRMALWLPMLFFGLHAAKAVLGNAARLVVHAQEGFNPRLWAVWASDDWTQPFMLIYYSYSPRIQVLNTRWQLDTWPPVVWGLLGASAVAPITLWLIMVFSRRDDFRWREVMRAGVYGLAWVPAFWVLGVIDAGWRLVSVSARAAFGAPVNGWDSEWLYAIAWEVWTWWVWIPAAWWMAWWWWAFMRGGRGRPDKDLAVVVIGAGMAAGIVAMAGMEVLSW